MHITIEITPKVRGVLARQAALTGCEVEVHAATVLEEALHLSAEEDGAVSATPLGRRLVDAFAKARGLFAESDLDFRRDSSPGRPIGLS